MTGEKTKSANKERLAYIDRIVGSNLKKIRLFRGLSQKVLAHKLGITFQQVQKYETGKNRLSSSTSYNACQILDVPLITLFEGLDSPVVEQPIINITSRKVKIMQAFDLISPAQQKAVLEILKVMSGL